MTSLDNCFQIAYVTNDFERALGELESRFGLAGMLRTDPLIVELDAGTRAQLRHAVGYVGALQFEVVQPVAGAVEVFTRGLPAGGFHLALHHVCVDVATEAEFEAALARHRANGTEILFEGRRVGRSRFAFADTRAQLGHMIEILHATPEGRAARAGIPRL